MKLREDYLIREIAGNYVIFPVGQSVVDYKNLMQLNESGRFIAELVKQGIEYEELLQAMVHEYEAEPSEVEILKKDLDAFLEILNGKGMLAE